MGWWKIGRDKREEDEGWKRHAKQVREKSAGTLGEMPDLVERRPDGTEITRHPKTRRITSVMVPGRLSKERKPRR